MTVTGTTFTSIGTTPYCGKLGIKGTGSLIGYDQGVRDGIAQTTPLITQARAQGLQSFDDGYTAGHDDGDRTGFGAGLSTGGSGAIIPDTNPPVLNVTYPTNSSDPLIVSLYDDSGLLLDYEVTVGFHNTRRLVAYNDLESFFVPFDRGSTVSGAGTISSPKIITIYIYGGWATNAQLDVKAKVIDKGGNRTVA